MTVRDLARDPNENTISAFPPTAAVCGQACATYARVMAG
jgi:hypothetical protein